MLDPYRMIAVNLFSTVLLTGAVLFYKFIYQKKTINFLFLLFLISILPIISIFRNGAYESGDFNIHIYRTMAFYESLKEGNVMPSWAENLNATYGYPLFIFNYAIPYYLISFFHLLGFSFIMSMKIFLASTYILSGISMYAFTKELFKNKLAAFTSGIFYIFTPYHLIDLHFKVAIGELLTFTLIPLVFLFIYKLYFKRKFIFVILSAFSFSLVIMSNALIGFFVGIFAFSYAVFLGIKDKLNLKYLFLITSGPFLSVLLCLYILAAPFIFYEFLFIQNVPLKIGYSPNLLDLLYSPYRFGFLFQGHHGEIPYLIGYTQIFIVFILILYLIRGNIHFQKNNIYFWIISIIFIIFLITPFSRFFWEYFSFIKAAGSHRLLLILTFVISILAGYLSLTIKNKFFIKILIVITIGYTILNWGHRRVIPEINDNSFKINLWKSTSEGEGHYYANTKWVDIKHPWFSELPKSHVEILEGKGEIKNILRTSTKHQYIVAAQSPLLVKENTLYFPGWMAKIDNKKIPINPNNKGIISFTLPKGNYKFELIYEDLPIYKTVKIVSFMSLCLSLFYIINYYLLKKIYAKK